MKKVVIVGGGISGLSCAFDLCDDFDVTIVERDAILGGQSRSFNKDGVHLCYSWRIFTSLYKNLLFIFHKIPTPTGSVRDNMIPVGNGAYVTGTSDEEKLRLLGFNMFTAPSDLSVKERRSIFVKFCTLATMSKERLYSLEDVTFFDYVNPISDAAKSYVDHIVGPFLGLESRRASVLQVVTMMNCVYANAVGMVPNAPYNEAIFDHWKKYLETKGCRFVMNTNVTQISNDAVHTPKENIKADYTVLCVDQHSLQRFQKTTPDLNMQSISRFVDRASQTYFSFEILFYKKVDFNHNVFTVKECEWLPIVERWNAFWKKEFLPVGVVEQWNVAVLDNIYEGRRMSEYSQADIIEKTLLQMKNSKMLSDVLYEDGDTIWNGDIQTRAWPYWEYTNGRLLNVQSQYKISWNKGTFGDAPAMQTGLRNVLVGCVCARKYPIVTQEAACFNGRMAANTIRVREGMKKVHIYFPKETHFKWLPTRLLDKLLFGISAREISYNEKGLIVTNLILLIAVACLCLFVMKR